MTRRLDPLRDDAGVRLRTARQRRGMTQTVLADLACISPAFVSMVETGQRELTRARDIIALADVLKVSPCTWPTAGKTLPRRDSGLPGRYRSRPAVIRSRWPSTSGSPSSSSSLPARTAAQPGTGYAAWPASPACIPGYSSTSSPRSAPPQAITKEMKPPMIRAPSATRSADRWFTVVDGGRLRQLRRQHGLSPAELAAKAGISLPTVLRLERQPRPSCRTRTAARLATALGQSAPDLTCNQPSRSHAAR